MRSAQALALAVALTAPAAALVASGCDSFPTPAALDHTIVLAVVADPPIVAPGGSSHLTFVAAGPDGPATLPSSWAMTPATPGVAPFGTVVANPDGSATYTAPAQLPTLPMGTLPVDDVQLTATPTGEAPIVAVKAIGVVAGVPSANPTISDVTLGGASVAGGGSITHGQRADLAVTIAPAADDKTTYAWYSTAGTIEKYQSNPTAIVGADAAHAGWLFVVVRDGKGGVAVKSVPLAVQ